MQARKNPWGIIEIPDEMLDLEPIHISENDDGLADFSTISVGNLRVGLVNKSALMFIETKTSHPEYPKSISIDTPSQARLLAYALLRLVGP
jgi:hypothetical protein